MPRPLLLILLVAGAGRPEPPARKDLLVDLSRTGPARVGRYSPAWWRRPGSGEFPEPRRRRGRQRLIEARQPRPEPKLPGAEDAALLHRGPVVIPSLREGGRVDEAPAWTWDAGPGVDRDQSHSCLHESPCQQQVLAQGMPAV